VSSPGSGIAGIVLAAGGSTRFGGPKQLAPLAGRPLLEHVATVLAEGAFDDRIVVLGADAERIRGEVDLHGARAVVCREWEQGQALSLATGIAAAGTARAAVILVGDQPLVTAAAIERVLAARGGDALAVRATYDGRPGHPVVIERPLFERVLELRGDAGARALFEGGAEVKEVGCEDVASGLDVDTLDALRRAEAEIARRAPAGPDGPDGP
jgi:molybdenum cofactor cytidylyltransferase